MSIISVARDIAEMAHVHQIYSPGISYEVHLAETCDILTELGVSDEEVIAAGWLHDIIEDGIQWTPARLLDAGVTPYTVAIVDAVTDRPGKNRAERKALTYPRIARMQDAVIVKVADRIANVRACIRTGDSRSMMYLKEYPGFRMALKDGTQNWHGWFTLDNEISRLSFIWRPDTKRL